MFKIACSYHGATSDTTCFGKCYTSNKKVLNSFGTGPTKRRLCEQNISLTFQ